ncbi:hypothetical protein COOONC_26644 [Cooperia oncophora]
MYQDFTMTSRFRGKYLSVIPSDTHVYFPGTKNHYSYKKITTTVHNIIVGKLWIDNHGDMEIINHGTGDKCVVKFFPYSYFSREAPRKVGVLLYILVPPSLNSLVMATEFFFFFDLRVPLVLRDFIPLWLVQSYSVLRCERSGVLGRTGRSTVLALSGIHLSMVVKLVASRPWWENAASADRSQIQLDQNTHIRSEETKL